MSIPAPTLPHLAYRRDIDGLRAIAVLSVVVYHAFPALLQGGFVGVDVFFVISGYLISRILFGGLARDDKVDFVDFYRRRVRRIFPALTLVLCVTLVAGWFLLTPNDFRHLGKHVLGGAGFVANLLLWQEAGYFDAAAELKPLLHLWSLGVEEQFYFFWPIALWIGWKARMDRRLLLGTTIVASFALNLWMARHDPVGDFFSPLPRFWELGIGAALAQASMRDGLHLAAAIERRTGIAEARAADAMSVLGLASIAIAVTCLHRGLAFPGAYAVLPVAGAALLIAAGPGAVVNRTLLSWRMMVGIGLISYPLYLWHWPVFSFARIAAPDALTAPVMAGLSVLAVVLAALTYHLVEKPLRFGGGRRPLMLAGAMAIVGMCGGVTFAMQGFAGRYHDDIAAYANYQYEFLGDARGNKCWLNNAARPDGFAAECVDGNVSKGRPRLVVWGDSHAARLYPGLRAVTGEQFAFAQYTRDACPPMLGLSTLYDNCIAGNRYVLDQVRGMQDATVVLFAYWGHYVKGDEDLRALGDTLDALRAAKVHRVVVLGPGPEWSTPLPNNLVQLWRTQKPAHLPERTTFGLVKDTQALDARLAAFVRARGDVVYFSPWSALCDKEGCLTRTGTGADTLTAFDYGHFTTTGATYVARALGRETHGFADIR